MRRGDFAAALSVYDRMVYPAASDIVLDRVDAAALLWRLELAGVDVAGRWSPLASPSPPEPGAGTHAAPAPAPGSA